METYLDQAPCIYFSSTDDGILVEVNTRLCKLLGYKKSELVNNKAEIIFTVPTKIFQQTHFFPLLKMQGYAEEIFITLQKKDGHSLPVLINAERKTMDGKSISIYIGIVVHQRQKFEDELIRAKKTAENALNENTALAEAKAELQKHSEELDRQIQLVSLQNGELRQFNHVVTHDMQEPLRKLSILSNMLIEDKGKTDQKILAEKIRRVTIQMREILYGLQQYVWLNETPLQPMTVDLSKLIPDIQKELSDEFPDVQLEVRMDEVREFTADPDQIHLLFYQLLSNAIRFRKDQHTAIIYISANTVQQNQFRKVEGKYKYVEYLRITVRDEGMGFNPEYKTQVFELFKKLHHESGRGIGLSLCKKIIDNHHGSISIDSKIDEGTTVFVQIPLAATIEKFSEITDIEMLINKTLQNTHE